MTSLRGKGLLIREGLFPLLHGSGYKTKFEASKGAEGGAMGQRACEKKRRKERDTQNSHKRASGYGPDLGRGDWDHNVPGSDGQGCEFVCMYIKYTGGPQQQQLRAALTGGICLKPLFSLMSSV